MLKHGRNSLQHIFSYHAFSFRCVSGYTSSAINSGTSDLTVDYLVNSLGFSKQEAIVASYKVSPFKSPEKPNSVVTFLKSSGLNETQIRKVVLSLPRILSSDVDKTLNPKFEAFKLLGLSGSDLAEVISVHPHILLRALDNHILPTLDVLKSVFGDKFIMLEALKKRSWVLSPGVLRKLPPNVALLKSYGLSVEQIKMLFLRKMRYLVMDPKWLLNVLIRVEEKFGIPRDSPMFPHGICALGSMSEVSLESKLKVFRSCGWSDSDILAIARQNPRSLALSESKLRSSLNFFMKDVGLQPSEIASQVYLLTVSLERRVIPRSEVLKVLKQKRLIKPNYKLSTYLVMTEERFVKRFLVPFKDELPDLYADYMRRVCSASKPSE